MEVHFAFTTTAAPVGAEGTVAGRRFYFRSRHEEWTFAVAERPVVDPVDLESTGDEDRGWVRTGRFDHPSQGSHLSAAEAESLIRACAAAYIADRAS